MRILIVGSSCYGRAVKSLGKINSNIDHFLSNPKEYGLVLFTGGSDISPELYGDKSPKHLCCSNIDRDKAEMIIFSVAKNNNIPMTGICRGSQFLNIMSGGTLMHDITGHTSFHLMSTLDGKKIEVTSTHHQMCIIGQKGYVLAHSTINRSSHYIGKNDELVEYSGPEVEAITYPGIFAVQYHPEYMEYNSEGYKWFSNGVKNLISLPYNKFLEEYVNIKRATK